jgi:predicted nucleic acid-binding protein
MTRVIFLDTSPLSLLTLRKGHPKGEACRAWLAGVLAAGAGVFVPEIADYELRRELIRAGKKDSLARLDAFNAGEPGRYVPLTTAAMRRAAELWAEVRRQGQPTAADPALDADVILAAQALEQGLAGVIVATSNTAHLSRFVTADIWDRIR